MNDSIRNQVFQFYDANQTLAFVNDNKELYAKFPNELPVNLRSYKRDWKKKFKKLQMTTKIAKTKKTIVEQEIVPIKHNLLLYLKMFKHAPVNILVIFLDDVEEKSFNGSFFEHYLRKIVEIDEDVNGTYKERLMAYDNDADDDYQESIEKLNDLAIETYQNETLLIEKIANDYTAYTNERDYRQIYYLLYEFMAPVGYYVLKFYHERSFKETHANTEIVNACEFYNKNFNQPRPLNEFFVDFERIQVIASEIISLYR